MSFVEQLFSLQNKVAVVVGGTSGIGQTIARGFARASAVTVASSRDQAKVNAMAGEIEALGARTLLAHDPPPSPRAPPWAAWAGWRSWWASASFSHRTHLPTSPAKRSPWTEDFSLKEFSPTQLSGMITKTILWQFPARTLPACLLKRLD